LILFQKYFALIKETLMLSYLNPNPNPNPNPVVFNSTTT